MPTYEYSCRKCGHTFEFTQSMKVPALETCPEEICPQKPWGCGAVQRGIGGGAGLIFKGSGFYITDYRSEGYKAAAKSDAETSKPKTDSNPAPSPAAKPAAPATPASTSS